VRLLGCEVLALELWPDTAPTTTEDEYLDAPTSVGFAAGELSEER
jgi:hypothetical protein